MASLARPWRLLPIAAIIAVSPCAQATPAMSTVVAFYLSTPVGNLILGPDGALYGASASSTSQSGGLIYRAAVDGRSVTTQYQMGANDGVFPQGGLLLATDGLLYGTTQYGVAGVVGSAGTVFRVALNGSGFTTLHTFQVFTTTNQSLQPINADGAYPHAALIEGSDGNLYGTARAGGTNGTGTIFRLSRDGTAFQRLHQFGPITSASGVLPVTNPDGGVPLGALLQGADGYVYGTTSAGGVNGGGAVYRIAGDGTGFQLLHVFGATVNDPTTGRPVNVEGATPLVGLTDGHDGYFYGVATIGGRSGLGTVFAMSPDGSTFTVLHAFDGNDGSTPSGELLLGQDGKLYGTTAAGGTDATGASTTYGTLFSIARDGTGFAVIHNMDNVNGNTPASRLLQLSSTVFLGTAASGGNCGTGTIYSFSTTGATVTGDTACGVKQNPYGSGAAGPALLLLVGGLGLARRRRRA